MVRFGRYRDYRRNTATPRERGIERREKQRQTHLNPRLERQVCIARVAHLENAAESILGQVADFKDLEIRGHGAQVEFANEDVIDDDGRLG